MTDPQPAWYPDPNDPSRQRWWDGSQWTEHVHGVSWTPDHASSDPSRLASPGAPTGTPWIWVVVLLPLVPVAALGLVDWRAYLEQTLAVTMMAPASPGYLMQMMFPAGTGWLVLLGLAVNAAVLLFAWLDRRTLVSRGIPRPFHWGWAALALVVSNGVYVIGRGVVLRRRTGAGLAPVWVWIAVQVVGLIVAAVFTVWILGLTFDLLFEQMPPLQTTSA
jgi:hypothetical protein